MMLDMLMQHGIGVGGGSNVKGVQRGIFSFTSGEKTKRIEISSVDLDRSVVLVHYAKLGSQPSRDQKVRAQLVSDTEIEFNIEGDAYTNTIAWDVIEFNNVKSLQRGTLVAKFTNITSRADLYIQPVNIQKSMVFFSNTTNYISSQSAVYQRNVRYSFMNSSCIGFYQDEFDTITKVIDWQVVEFN